MPKLNFEISMSLDGYVAGPEAGVEHGLGIGGERLHEWVLATRAWRENHGREGGEEGPDSDLMQQSVDRSGATIMGRRMFSGAEGSWEDDPNRDGWWGDEPPFHHPVFVITHHERESQEMAGGTTFHFVTDGIEAALERAREAAGGEDVGISGGADVAQQYLVAGLIDEVLIHIAPVLLGGGVPLFDGDMGNPKLELIETIDSPHVTHVRYRVVK